MLKKIAAIIVGLAVALGCSAALASSAVAAAAINPVGHSFLYLGGGLLVVSSIAVMFDKRLD